MAQIHDVQVTRCLQEACDYVQRGDNTRRALSWTALMKLCYTVQLKNNVDMYQCVLLSVWLVGGKWVSPLAINNVFYSNLIVLLGVIKLWTLSIINFILNFFFNIYLTRKCLIEIKNLLCKRVLAKTAAVAHYTQFQTIQHKTVRDNIIKKERSFFLDHSVNQI